MDGVADDIGGAFLALGSFRHGPSIAWPGSYWEGSMPVTLSYDLGNVTPNQRNYVRSMFERFGWKRLGGSVFRYNGRSINHILQEDWFNDVVPAIMFFRAFALQNGIEITRFTLDAASVARIEPGFGRPPKTGANLILKEPTNVQSSAQALRDFVDATTAAAP